MAVAEPLNLLHLARAAGDQEAAVPGTDLWVGSVEGRRSEHLRANAWCLVLDGDLIIDLPLGAFRILATGDALHLPAGLDLSLQSVGGAALLAWRYGSPPDVALD